jgi:hypothetical protein
MEFIQAIWPDFTEASLSLFTEESLLRDAINLIRKLRAVEATAREVSLALHKADIHEVEAPLDAALLGAVEDVIDSHVLRGGICRCGWGLKAADKRYARHLAEMIVAADG